MPKPRAKTSRASLPTDKNEDPVRYPTDTVLGIIKTVKQCEDAVAALEGGGFLESEIRILHGKAAAERLANATGRRGLAGLLMQLVESIGLPNDETALKAHFSEALRKGWFVVGVHAPSDERQQAAERLLHEHGGKFVHFFGRFTIEPSRSPQLEVS